MRIRLYFARRRLALTPLRARALALGGGPGNWTRLPADPGNEAVKFGSYFHQFSPICSALSTEQTSKRMRIVNNSTLAREMRMSPAITSPLSSTRSRMSTRLVVPETVGTLCICYLRKQTREDRPWGGHSARPTSRILTSTPHNCQLHQIDQLSAPISPAYM